MTCQLRPARSPAPSAWSRQSQRAQVSRTHLLIDTVHSIDVSMYSDHTVLSVSSGGGGGSAPQPVVPTPKDKSGAPPVRSIHDDLVNVATPLSAHRQVSTKAEDVKINNKRTVFISLSLSLSVSRLFPSCSLLCLLVRPRHQQQVHTHTDTTDTTDTGFFLLLLLVLILQHLLMLMHCS